MITENTENLILEHLGVIGTDMASMKEEMSGIRAELFILRQHVGGLLGAQIHHETETHK